VTGTDPGDSVEVWFEGGGQRSESFTYQAVSETPNRVLVVAAEDYTGASPVQDPAGPHFVDPFTGLEWGLDDPAFAGNTLRRSSFLATSGILPVDQYKQFESWPSARYDKPGGPFDPHTGEQYVYSQIADVSYKRLTREIAVPATGGSMTF